MMDFSTVEQRSEEWHEARLGKVTASRVADMMAKTKTGPSASRKNYRAELVLERLTGQRTPDGAGAMLDLVREPLELKAGRQIDTLSEVAADQSAFAARMREGAANAALERQWLAQDLRAIAKVLAS